MDIKGRCESVEFINKKAGISTLKINDFESKEVITVQGPIPEPMISYVYILKGEYDDNGIFAFSSYRRSVDSREESVDVVRFSGLGIKRDQAENIVAALGDDIFDVPETCSIYSTLMNINGIGDKKARALEKLIRQSQAESGALKLLSDGGISFTDSLKFLGEKGPNAYHLIKKNPYVLNTYGVSFEDCDRLASSLGMDIWDKRRIHALINESIHKNENNGSTRMTSSKLLSQVKYISGRNAGEVPSELSSLYLKESETELYVQDEEEYAQSKAMYEAERSIADNLLRIDESARPLADDIDSLIKKTESRMGIRFNAEQKEVFNILKDGGINILSGDPGSGKTTTLSGIVMAYRFIYPDLNPLLIAPTGRAAARMNEISGSSAKTIHKALGLKYFDIGSAVAEELLYDLIIVDEMSMTDTALFSKLLSTIRCGTCVLLVGDYNQLPSVGPGRIFRDLCECGKYSSYRLTHTERQNDESTIVTNAKCVLNGADLKETADFTIESLASDEELAERIRKICLADNAQLLCPTKKGQIGCDSINKMLQESRHLTGKSLWLNHTCFKVGDRVIMNENRYDLGFMNGDVGYIDSMSEGYVTIRFTDKILSIEISELSGMSLAYALTVHKSQGAENDIIYIVLPDECSCMAKREILYTAITRAKKEVHIIEKSGLIKRYLSDEKAETRDCGLLHELTKEPA